MVYTSGKGGEVLADKERVVAKWYPFIFGALLSLFGEWTYAMKVLVLFMIFDYLLGLSLSLLGLSHKTENGKLQSKAMFIGIMKKVLTLMLVAIAHQVGIVMGITQLRDTVVIGLITYELISILEHMASMGVKLPQALIDVLEIMKSEEERGIES